MKRKPIREQVVVIVGASSGIGRETALQFSERGAKVVLAGRSQEALDQLTREIKARGGEALSFSLDVANYDQVQDLADHAVSTFGRIDTWVHLAAVNMYAKFTDTSPEEFRRILEVNLLGQVHGAMAALPHLKRSGAGALIHVSSTEARRALPLTSAYSASKHGMVGFLDSLRMELEHEGSNVTVTNVMPASINTPLFNKALTRLGTMPRPIPPVYEPSVAAEAILYAAEHPVREIFIGSSGKGLSLMQRISPRLTEKMLRNKSFQLQRSNRPKSADAPHNLYTHIEGYDRTQGDFSQEAREKSMYTMAKTSRPLGWLATAALVTGAVILSMRALQAYKERTSSARHKLMRRLRNNNLTRRIKRIRNDSLTDRIRGSFRQDSFSDRVMNRIR